MRVVVRAQRLSVVRQAGAADRIMDAFVRGVLKIGESEYAGWDGFDLKSEPWELDCFSDKERRAASRNGGESYLEDLAAEKSEEFARKEGWEGAVWIPPQDSGVTYGLTIFYAPKNADLPPEKRKWDYQDFKLHPLWDVEPQDTVTERITVGGEPLFRGTSTDFLDAEGLHAHPPGGHGEHTDERIYVSEGSEDAKGYACIASETHGGTPLLCTVRVTEEIFKQLKPGYEGYGEWYIDSGKIPTGAFRCRRLRPGACAEYGSVPV